MTTESTIPGIILYQNQLIDMRSILEFLSDNNPSQIQRNAEYEVDTLQENIELLLNNDFVDDSMKIKFFMMAGTLSRIRRAFSGIKLITNING
jgi:hypothetical protein